MLFEAPSSASSSAQTENDQSGTSAAEVLSHGVSRWARALLTQICLQRGFLDSQPAWTLDQIAGLAFGVSSDRQDPVWSNLLALACRSPVSPTAINAPICVQCFSQRIDSCDKPMKMTGVV